jgi:aspartate dehydrogenase
VGIIGYGAIGRGLCHAIAAGQAGRCEVAAVLVRDVAKYREVDGVPLTGDVDAFFATPSELIVEVAGHDALKALGERALLTGRDLLSISVGAFADRHFEARIQRARVDSGRRVLLATGAIAGIDAISAAAIGGLTSVTHSVRKPPRGLLPADQVDAVMAEGKPIELYHGPAREAAIRFPENVNVAAAVSLAGLGLDRTMVRVVADPSVERNTHVVEAAGEFGDLTVTLRNIPSENPKTGRLTWMSMVKALRNLTDSWVVGV